ncbi:MAG TPA: LysR substrate-binding domain-containing protein [Steroidobacteraceae bacterium]|nr:LysR substrate-binding domain-containing protein [Steroidobacteraceae bacterium]
MQTLRAFEAAARHENYSAAAQELGVTHGAISHRIRELETQLGVTLFRRTGRAMTPSREAVTLLAQVREALNLLERALPAGSQSTPGHLVIGIHPSLATRWLIPRLGKFTGSHPRATIEVRSTADLGDFLAHGVDIAIRYGAGTWPNAARERVAGEVLFPVCAPAYRDAHRLQRPADLARCRLLRHAWQPWAPWLRAARVKLAEPTEGLILSDSAMLLEAAAAGEGVALARSLFAIDDLANGRLVRLFDGSIEDTFSYYALWHPGMPLNALGTAFRDWLRVELVTERARPVASRPAPSRTVARGADVNAL